MTTPAEWFQVGTVVIYVGGEIPHAIGRRGVVTHAPRPARRNMSPKTRWHWVGMRVRFDGESEGIFAWPDQYEVVGAVDLLAEIEIPASASVRKRVRSVVEDSVPATQWLDARVQSVSAKGVEPGHLGTVEEVGQGAKAGFVWVRWDSSPARFRGKATRVDTDAPELLDHPRMP